VRFWVVYNPFREDPDWTSRNRRSFAREDLRADYLRAIEMGGAPHKIRWRVSSPPYEVMKELRVRRRV